MGGDWVPGQTIDILVDDDGVADAELGEWHHAAAVTAYDDGTVYYQFNLPNWFVANYTVVAAGECTTATTAFTDANVNVTSAPANNDPQVLFNLTHTVYSGSTNCSAGAGTPATTNNVGSTTTGTGMNRWNIGLGSNDSVRLEAAATANQPSGWTFSHWTGPSGNFPAGQRVICAPGTFSTADYKAVYQAKKNTDLSVASATGTYGGTVNLSATLTAGGSGVSDKTVTFTLNGTAVCGASLSTACPTTNGSGVATLSGVGLSGINVGTYATAVGASFAADSTHNGSTGTSSLTVTKKAASVTPAAASKTYGAADPALSGTLSGFLAADNVTATYSRAAGETVAGSPYTISATLSPAGVLGNYDITYNMANFTINKRAITVTADAKSKVYGAADPTLTYSITSGTLVGSDAFTGSLTRAAGENVGTYAIAQGTLALNSNYTLTYVGANLTITAKAVTITPDSGQSKVYGSTGPTLTLTNNGGLAAGDFTGALSREGGESVGTFAITLGDLSAGANYTLSLAATPVMFEITPRPIEVTADAQSKTYGDADPSLTYKVTSGNLVNGDAFSGALTRVEGETVGTYAIGPGTLALSTNYTLTYVGANLTITARPIAVKADDKTKVIGAADPALTYTVTGNLVTGDSFSGALTRAAGEAVGSYAITQGTLALSSNYALSFTPGTLKITYALASVSCAGSPSRTILQPINADGTSVFKLGSTVPAKFRVCDANGNSIGTAGVVVSFQLISTTSGTSTTTVTEEVLSTTPDKAFRWDATNQQWIFNIDTKNLSSGLTYTYRITLNDGTYIDFKFGMRK